MLIRNDYYLLLNRSIAAHGLRQYNEGMNNQPGESADQHDLHVLEHARTVADAVVQEQGSELATALESGNVTAIESAFYRVFLQIYVKGYEDGSLHRHSAWNQPEDSKTEADEL